jgi:hypothetical protein
MYKDITELVGNNNAFFRDFYYENAVRNNDRGKDKQIDRNLPDKARTDIRTQRYDVTSLRFIKNKYTNIKTLITNKCTKRVLLLIVTHSYMFRPCWIIFRENFSLPLH